MLPIDPATHTLSLGGRYYIYKERWESRDFSKVYGAVFKQLRVLAVGHKEAAASLWTRDSFFRLNIFITTH